jgi:hypothetical protein
MYEVFKRYALGHNSLTYWHCEGMQVRREEKISGNTLENLIIFCICFEKFEKTLKFYIQVKTFV